ncbi:hypothetical protein FDT66_03780 [Polaribacter aestuariivivens]|uniref:Outer membrane protein beta-barrel domain-containing protein n=1 Tax=Polaribacter aestuariivivens TaxID=2304626 RepID=A0A5S3N6X3_9FLAO|nr:hypothetical protein [Polaribacter aestuariivivens]TMM31098.1 hypothetical protein FDT66_03780 [Polaribacter aestuariivivens]
MKIKFLFTLLILTSFSIFGQDEKNNSLSPSDYHTLDIKNLELDDNFLNIYYEGGSIMPYETFLKNFIVQGKIGVGYSATKFENNESSLFYLPLQVGGGFMFEEDIFKFYSTLSAGLQIGYSDIKIATESSSEFLFDFISYANFGGMVFFGKESKYGIQVEYNYAIEGVDRVLVGLAIRL